MQLLHAYAMYIISPPLKSHFMNEEEDQGRDSWG